MLTKTELAPALKRQFEQIYHKIEGVDHKIEGVHHQVKRVRLHSEIWLSVPGTVANLIRTIHHFPGNTI